MGRSLRDIEVVMLLGVGHQAAVKSQRGRGASGGAFGTPSWTDPTEEITAVLMVQQTGRGLIYDLENAIREAIVD